MRETPRAHADLSVEGVAAHSGSVLVLRGDVNRAEVPHLAFVMDSVVALDPASLVIDLSETHSIALDALAIIAKAVAGLPKAEIRLPEASAEALLRLVAA